MPKTLRGQFLIATRRLRDPNFFRSVVLIVEHGKEGAMGLIVNRPSSVTVARALEEHFELPETGELVYIGGPVEPSALFILHNSRDLDAGERPVVPGVFIGSSGTVFEDVVRSAESGDTDLRFRVLCGCAGWAPGQLEGEVSRGDWLVRPGNNELTFSPNPYEVWEEAVGMLSTEMGVLPSAPGNPEWN
jgi:putative transcriptional regulator